MNFYSVDQEAFDCRVIQIKRGVAPTTPEVGDRIDASFGGDARVQHRHTGNGVYNYDAFVVVAIVAELEDVTYVLGVRQ